MTPSLKLRPVVERRAGAARDLDAAAADVDRDRHLAGAGQRHRRPRDGSAALLPVPEMTRARMPVCWSMALRNSPPFSASRTALVATAIDVIDLVRLGEPAELREHLQRRLHRLGRQRPAVEPAGAKPDHLLLAVDDLERQIRPDAHDDHVQRIGADVDGGETHAIPNSTPGAMPESRRYGRADVITSSGGNNGVTRRRAWLTFTKLRRRYKIGEMFELYLIRHAVAEERGEKWPDDVKRPLTAKGAARMRKAARGLVRLGLKFDVILSSPLVRTRQTAEIVAAGFDARPPIVTADSLAPQGSYADVLADLQRQTRRTRIALVGHEPNIGELAARLAGSRRAFEFKKGAVCRIDVESMPPGGPGTLRWFLTPAILRKIK